MNRKNRASQEPANGHDPIDAYVGKRLRMKRNLAGLSQKNLGKSFDLTFQQIQKYERGANRIGAGRLYRMARFLNVPVQWFYEGMPPELLNGTGHALDMSSMPDGDIFCQSETIDLVRSYYRITDQKQHRKFMDLLKSIAKPQ